MNKFTDQELTHVKTLILQFCDIETNFKNFVIVQNLMDMQKANEMIFQALINFVGNFIHTNALDEEKRAKTYTRFSDFISIWRKEREATSSEIH